jgi:hypothetical protein
MRTSTFAFIGLAAAAALSLTPASSFAQRSGGRYPSQQHADTSSIFDVTPYAGYMVFGNYVNGPLGSGVTNAPAPVFGVQFGMRLSPNVSMIGNVASANSDMQVGLPYIGGYSIAQSTILMYDAGLQFEMPMTLSSGLKISPFVQGGVGGMQYSITQSYIGSNTSATNLAGNVGAGADISVGRGFGIRLMAKDYFGNFNSQDATGLDIPTETSQNYVFSAGLKFSF